MDVRKLIDEILSDPRLEGSRTVSRAASDGGPLIRTASQMDTYLPERYRAMRALAQRPRASEGRAGDGAAAATFEPLPRLSGQGRIEGRPRRLRISGAELFARQAAFMADWEDDFPFNEAPTLRRPTYADLSDRQLRGYFTWRARARRGEAGAEQPTFSWLYCYELINGIGAETPIGCFEALKRFYLENRRYSTYFASTIDFLVRDLAAYHGIDPCALDECVDRRAQNALAVLRRVESAATDMPVCVPIGILKAEGRSAAGVLGWRLRELERPSGREGADSGAETPPYGIEWGFSGAGVPGDEEVLDALEVLAGSRVRDGAACGGKEEELAFAAALAFRAMARHCVKRRRRAYVDSLFGSPLMTPYALFRHAPFHEPVPHADGSYALSEAFRYVCVRGRWFQLQLYRDLTASADLRMLLEALAQRMASDEPCAPAPSYDGLARYQQRIVDEALEQARKRRAEREARLVRIDRSQLAGIRMRAAGIRDALLIDEEREADDVLDEAGSEERLPSDAERSTIVKAPDAPQGGEPGSPDGILAAPEPSSGPASACGLSELQARYLAALLEEGDAADALAQAHVSEALMVDAVNECLFDALGDTALEYGDAGVRIVEDYREEIEGMVG